MENGIKSKNSIFRYKIVPENNNDFIQINGDRDILSSFLNEQQLNMAVDQADDNQNEFQSFFGADDLKKDDFNFNDEIEDYDILDDKYVNQFDRYNSLSEQKEDYSNLKKDQAEISESIDQASCQINKQELSDDEDFNKEIAKFTVKSKEQVIKEDKNQLEEIKEFGKDDNKDTKNNPIEKNTNANQK